MRRLIIFVALLLGGCATGPGSNWELVKEAYGLGPKGSSYSTTLGDVQKDAYGPGLHKDAYGRPVQITPAFPDNGHYGNSEIQKSNAYGPGIHMDQYGRPVRLTPAW